MCLSKKQIFAILFLLTLLVDLLFVFDINYLLIRTILAALLLLFVPGILLLIALRPDKLEITESILYIIGLSISSLLAIGLFLNFVLPQFGYLTPLSFVPLNITFNVYLLIIGVLAYVRAKSLRIEINIPHISLLDRYLLLFPAIFPILSVIGVLNLNNQGSNIYAVSLLILIAGYLLVISLLHKHLKPSAYPLIIFLIGISLLFSYSLRSWHILGWDINEEFQMFQLTKSFSFWDITRTASPFNTTLSVTILPTIFSSYLRINDEYIFKLLFQVLFAIVPVGVYCLVKKYVNHFIAFCSSFFFMAQGLFYLGMPAVIRQETAFIFFILLFQTLFNQGLKTSTKNFLSIIFSFSLVVSHYSTSYVTLAYLVFCYLAVYILIPLGNRLPFIRINPPQRINLTPVISLLLFTFVWNVLITKSTNNIVYTFNSMIRNISNIASFNNKNATIFTFLFNKNYSYSDEQLNKFIAKYTSQYLATHPITPLLAAGSSKKYDFHFLTEKYISVVKTASNKLFLIPYTVDKYLVMFSLFIGLAFTYSKKGHSSIKFDGYPINWTQVLRLG